MAISGTSTDYSGRLKDIYVSGSLNLLSPSIQPITYEFGKPTKYIAGVQKLAQRYIISLINSGLIEQLLGSSSSNIQTAKNLFNVNNFKIIKVFKSYQNSIPDGILPLDEQLDTVQLTNVTSDGDAVTFSAKLITKTGKTVVVLLPLPLS